MTHEIFYQTSKRLTIFLSLLLILPSNYTLAEESTGLSLAISVPIHDSQRTIQVGRQALPFHIVIENSSDNQINLWREWNFWGYFNLQFQLTNEEGHTWIVKKKEKEWEKNFPDFLSFKPQDKMVIEVTFNPNVWDNVLPLETKQSTIVSMIAIYESASSDDSRERKVWSGQAISSKKIYTLVRKSN